MDAGSSFKDGSLANEAGDVMYYMEYNDAAVAAGSDTGPKDRSYTKPGSRGEFSTRVEDTYVSRRNAVQRSNDKKQAAKNLNNPYPLPQYPNKKK